MHGIVARQPRYVLDIHADHQRAYLGAIHPDVVARLLACPRVGEAARAYVTERAVAAGANPLDNEWDHPHLLTVPLDAIVQSTICAGAAWHGRALRHMLAADRVAAVTGAIGIDAFRHGVRHASPRRGGSPADPARLAEAIRADGWACLVALVSAAPEGAAAAMRLRFPADTDWSPPAASDDDDAPEALALRVAAAAEAARLLVADVA